MKLLLIGGTGFFGKSILDCFLKGELKKFKIFEIIILSRSTDIFVNIHPELLHPKVTYIKGDISKLKTLPSADIVIHAATSAKEKDYIENPKKERENTEKGVLNYIKLAKKNHRNSKIIYCSSGAVYGKQPANVDKLKEDFPFQNIDEMPIIKKDYALSKRNAESYIANLGNEGLNVSIARGFAFYGKYLPDDGHFAYSNFLSSAIKGRDIVVEANHEVIRSYMHADKLVESLLSISLVSNPKCPIYNVGSDIPISIFSLAKEIAAKYNVNVVTKSNIDLNKIDKYIPNIDKLKSLLNS